MEYSQEKQLSRVLFPIPEICKHLPESTKQGFLWNVRRYGPSWDVDMDADTSCIRDSPSSKIEDFVQQTSNIIYEYVNFRPQRLYN